MILDPEAEDDLALQEVIDETAAARGWPHTTWGMRAMLASVGLAIVRSKAKSQKKDAA